MDLVEHERRTPIVGQVDVLVCGSGPAGIGAALAAARAGATVCLVELHGCLGGVWTAGLLSNILDARTKPGLIAEIRERLRESGAIADRFDLYDAEAMKLLLEEMCEEAGIEVRLYTRLVGAVVKEGEIRHALFESKEGRFAIGARTFVDATGDGDLGAFAGCGFELGREEDGLTQPMTLMALVANVPAHVRSGMANPGRTSCLPKEAFYRLLCGQNAPTSYTLPSLFPLPNGLCALMINHEYERSGLCSRDLTRATVDARREIHRTVAAMRGFSEEWSGLTLVATAPQIGVREARRIHGLYRVTVDDIATGARHEDAITQVRFSIDVHCVRRSDGGGVTEARLPTQQPYDIPLRALISRDIRNLALAGRCISGDFLSHSSYRVTGNAVATGEAAGTLCALAAREHAPLGEVAPPHVLDLLNQIRTPLLH